MKDQSRYEILDALRGIAAIGVTLFHLSVFGVHFAPHGYLAVDFFFMLSGFVLAHAYEDRLFSSMSFPGFLRLRLIRIMPLSILGLLMGSAYFVIRFFSQTQSLYGLQDVLGSTIFNILLLPKPWMTAAPTDTVFPTNTPLWSLSLEMGVNLIWASFLFRLNQKALIAVVAFSAIALCTIVLWQGTADLGATWPTYFGGATRVAFGFFAGILIWKHRTTSSASTLYGACCALVLAMVFFIPQFGPLLDISVIAIVFPLVIIVATRSNYGSHRGLFRYIGQISFPLYVIHAPIMVALAGIAKALKIAGHPYAVSLVAVASSLLVAYVLDRTYDRFIRNLLVKAAIKPPNAGNRICDVPVMGK